MPNIDNFVHDGFISAGMVELGITLVHLTTGEDILGRVWKDDSTYRIERAVVPNIMADESGRNFRVGLMPYRPYAEPTEDIHLHAEHVMFTLKVNEQMQKVYQNFTSSIQVASPADVPNLSIIR